MNRLVINDRTLSLTNFPHFRPFFQLFSKFLHSLFTSKLQKWLTFDLFCQKFEKNVYKNGLSKFVREWVHSFVTTLKSWLTLQAVSLFPYQCHWVLDLHKEHLASWTKHQFLLLGKFLVLEGHNHIWFFCIFEHLDEKFLFAHGLLMLPKMKENKKQYNRGPCNHSYCKAGC